MVGHHVSVELGFVLVSIQKMQKISSNSIKIILIVVLTRDASVIMKMLNEAGPVVGMPFKELLGEASF